MVTEREIMLVSALYVTVVIFLYIQQYNQDALVQYLSHHKSEIENRQVADLQEAHRRRILSLKTEHNFDKHQLQGSLNVAIAKFDRLNGEYDWMSDAYQDQIRSLQEQEDRINYLEVKLHELGQTSPTIRQPFSAPPSQIRFANPPRRQHGAGAPSPLNQVSTPSANAAMRYTKPHRS
jgi:hypothetical protein